MLVHRHWSAVFWRRSEIWNAEVEIKCSDTESAVWFAPCHRLHRGLCSHLHRRLSKREGGIRPEGLYSVFPARVGAYRIPLLLNWAEITALPCATLRPCPQDQQEKGMSRKRGGRACVTFTTEKWRARIPSELWPPFRGCCWQPWSGRTGVERCEGPKGSPKLPQWF